MPKEYKALVVKDKAGLLPKGWITKVFGLDEEPSEYERSPGSPWKVKTFHTNPIDPRPLVRNRMGRMVKDVSDVYVLEGSNLKKKKHGDVWKKWKHAEGHKPPPHLKRSSVVWDYGPGRTYSTPQAAFDALLAYVGLNTFEETHYIRGWSGVYADATLEQTLHVHDVYPDQGQGHYLIIDAEPGETPVWQSEDYGVVGPMSDSYEGVGHYFVRDLHIRVVNPGGAAVASSHQNPQGKFFYESGLWLFVEDCVCEHVGVDTDDTVAFLVAGTLYPRISRCHVKGGFGGVGPTNEATRRDYSNVVYMKSSVFNVTDNAFALNAGSGNSFFVTLANCIVRAENNILSQTEAGAVAFSRVNCSFEAGAHVLYTPASVGFFIVDPWSDYNLYKYGSAFGQDKNGSYSFETLRNYMNVDESSVDNEDPLIDWAAIDDGIDENEIPVSEDSPLLRAGGTMAGTDYHGREVGRTIVDIGAFQTSGFDTVLVCGYCDEQDVIDECGVKPEDLDRSSDNALNALLCEWIQQCTEIINEYCGTVFEDPVPYGIRRACTMMTANVTNISRQRRKTNVLEAGQQDTFRVRVVKSDVLTDEVTEILDLYAVGKEVGDGSEEGTLLGMDVLTEDDY